MIEILRENWEILVTVPAVIAALIAAILSFTQLRRTRYESELNRVTLDHSRAVLEREVERLHEQLYKDGQRLSELNHLLIDSIRNREPDAGLDRPSIGHGSLGFLRAMGIEPDKVQLDPAFVFVLTPLNSSQVGVYLAIKKECERVGLHVRRGDETRIEGPILPHILKEILASRLIVANINGRNPNVFYELGIAQALGKPVVLVVRSYDEIPFDLRQQQVVIYSDLKELPERFSEALSRYALSVRDA